MNRIDRLMGVLTILQSKKYVPAEYIADQFAISVRTVYRDIKALGEIGIPLSFEPHKGYFIVQGYFLSPVAFTPQEANALVLMESIAGNFADLSIKQHYASALHKIKAILKAPEKDKIERMQAQIRIHCYPGERNTYTYLSEIQHAIVEHVVLKMDYQNIKLEKSQREVEPIGLTYYMNDWHMIAWCWMRSEYRDFKVSRILKLTNTCVPFRRETHLDLNEYIKLRH